MNLDLHVHIKRAHRLADLRHIMRRRRIDGIAVTNFWEISFARWIAKKLPEFLILVGKEVVTRRGHILAVGIDRDIPDLQDPEATILQIREAGGLAILPHPFLLTGSIAPVGKNRHLPVDAIESFNYRAGPFLWPNFLASCVLRHRPIPLLANSDSKELETIGACYNEIAGRTKDEIFYNLRQGNVRRHTALQRPTLRWLLRTSRNVILGHTITSCSSCGGSLKRTLRKHDLFCEICGAHRRSRIICRHELHFVCRACRTKRDYAPEKLLAYRRKIGADI